MKSLVLAAIFAFACAEPTVYFREEFADGAKWEDRWVQSTSKSDYGKFELTAGKFYGDAEKDQGLKTSTSAKFYSLSAKMEDSFSNEGKDLVVQFTVKHEQDIDCGGGYIKLLPEGTDQAGFNGDSKYFIMFGPDICGYSTKKVHVIINYNGENRLIKKEIKCKDDVFSHVYTLILKPDNTYVVKIDNEKVESGELEQDWDLLEPKMIKDPEAKKPEDWEDNAKMDDPEDTKPEDWEKPEHIADPDAKKPEEWDDEMDGEWEPPLIDNPEFKGEWKPKQIDNPKYKGEWVHPEIDNPDYKADDKLHKFEAIGGVGFDLWQVKAGTIFDNILVTDDVAFAEQVAKDTWGATKDAEKKMKESQDEEERKNREAEDAKKKEEEGDKEDEAGDEDADEEDDDADEAKDEELDHDEL